MALDLQIDQQLSATAQVVKDANDNTSPLSLSTDAVGIGTTIPNNKLHIVSIALSDANEAQFSISANNGHSILFGRAVDYGFIQSHNRKPLALNPLGNNVGIGTTSPEETLTVKGNILATGHVKLVGADSAEDFDVDELTMHEPGMVMVIGEEDRPYQCSQAYDRCVAVVILGADDCRPGIVLGKQNSNKVRPPLALSGKVNCKVDASYAPVNIGDLLTTSPTSGHAMKAIDAGQTFGAVVGKALRPLTEGTGLVPILISLQ